MMSTDPSKFILFQYYYYYNCCCSYSYSTTPTNDNSNIEEKSSGLPFSIAYSDIFWV